MFFRLSACRNLLITLKEKDSNRFHIIKSCREIRDAALNREQLILTLI